NGQPADLLADDLALARVKPAAHLEIERPHFVPYPARAADRARGSVEGGKEAVAGRVDLASAESRQLASRRRVVLAQHVAPAPIAERERTFRRADDVGEQDRREHAIGFGRTNAGEELLDLVDDRGAVAYRRDVVLPGQLDELRAGDVLGHVAGVPDPRDAVADTMDDERRDANGGKHVTNVDLGRESQDRLRRARARRHPAILREEAPAGL